MWRCTLGIDLGLVFFTVLPCSAFGRDLPAVQTFALEETKGLIERNVKLEPVEYEGRKAVRLTKESLDDGFALLPDSDFQDGTIEADIALKVTTPPGMRMPGFVGIAFRARTDGSHYELFYLRPGNSQSDDQAMRNHSVQYCAEPDHGWYALRRAWPAVYEAYADLQLEAWTHVKIEVAGRSAKLYLNGSAKPSLVVDGLKGADLHGAVALWGYAGEESYFSKLRITHASPQPVKNGAEAGGVWDVKFGTDAGGFQGSLKLNREGNNLTGTWSGDLGEDRPVAGAWRDGYVELTFTASWPKDWPQGAPGEVTTSLAGWIDGTSAKGRVKVEGRADGQWTATRKE
ncbi:MAG: hypothetical protein LAP39_18510 [Acidobacteriia bacterium]|nr:hypothetical protein [Terriglobia bacterium]